MKKFVLSLLFVFLLIGSVSAISVDMKESYLGKETMIIEIQGNILEPIVKGDVEFKRANVRLPLEFDVKRLGERYFLWAVAPEEKGNYSIFINEISTTVSGKNEEVDFSQDFLVLGNLTSYNVKPGFEFALENFEIQVFLFDDISKEININFGAEGNLNLKPGENTFTLDVADFEQGLVIAEIGNYNVPVYIAKKSGNGQNIANTNEKIEIFPIEIKRVVRSVSGLFYPISIKNEGDVRVDFVEIWSDNEDIKISPDKFGNLSAGSELEFNLSFGETIKEGFEDVVYVQIGEIIHILPVSIDFLEENESLIEENSDFVESGYYCVELGGQICSSGNVCSNEVQNSLDGSCCLSECKEGSSDSGNGGLIGWLIFGIVIVGGIILWVKFKKAKPSESGLNKALRGVKGPAAIVGKK